ncbi:MAG TPA: hypothetical protein VGQ00_01400 [Candidatus Norongarragalinales archaeon]|jgi:hypothetical protein|nr:hypothetical protein [Candidatus Norongarragalinales archaeon]
MPREQIDEDEYESNLDENIEATVGDPETTIIEFKCQSAKCKVVTKITQKELLEGDLPEHHGKPMTRSRTYQQV